MKSRLEPDPYGRGVALRWPPVNTGLFDPHHTEPAKRLRFEEHQARLRGEARPQTWGYHPPPCG